VTLTRIYRFAASHRLHSPQLPAEENARLYGKCNNPHGHGHDYVLHVSVSGCPDQGTGRLVNIGDLDRYVQERVLRLYDHRDLNHDVAGFAGVPTTENLARDTDRRLRSDWPFHPVSLGKVLIQETPRNSVEFRAIEHK